MTYSLPGRDHSFTYGWFLGVTKRGQVAVVDASADSTFDEISALISADSRANGLSERERAELVRAATKVVYDPAPDGDSFVIQGSPGCPNCGGRTVAGFAETEEDWSVSGSVMTHHRWDRLSGDDKERVIEEFLDGALGGA